MQCSLESCLLAFQVPPIFVLARIWTAGSSHLKSLEVEFYGFCKQQQQFDANFCQNFVEFEIAHLSVLPVWRLLYRSILNRTRFEYVLMDAKRVFPGISHGQSKTCYQEWGCYLYKAEEIFLASVHSPLDHIQIAVISVCSNNQMFLIAPFLVPQIRVGHSIATVVMCKASYIVMHETYL